MDKLYDSSNPLAVAAHLKLLIESAISNVLREHAQRIECALAGSDLDWTEENLGVMLISGESVATVKKGRLSIHIDFAGVS